MSYNTFQDLSFIEKLPKNWDVRKFSDIFTDVSGGNVKLQKSDFQTTGKYPIIDQGQSFIAGYTSDTNALCNTTLPVIVFGDHTRAFKYISFKFVMGADGTKVLQPNGDAKVEVKYVYHFLKSVKLPDKGYSRHFKYLKDVALPLPPLSEQKRIAAILDKAEEIKRKREESLKLADEFLKSVFVDMFGDPVTNPKGWEMKPIVEFGRVVTGNTPSRNAPHYYGDHIEWIKSDNINTPSHFLTQSTEMLSEEGRKVGRVVPKGSVLVTCIAGSPSCIGNSAIADRDVAFNQQINAFVPNYEEFGTFFYLMLFANKKLIQAASTNSMKGMVNKSTFESINILCPPKQMIIDLHNIFRKALECHTNLNISYKDSMSCVKSLEQTFFNGEGA